MMEILQKREPLCKELQAYHRHHNGFNSIRHPLVYSMMHNEMLNALVNRQLIEKKERVAEALAEKDYGRYVFIHEKPYRFDAFYRIKDQLQDKQYWEILGDIWINSENIWQNKKGWRELLKSTRPFRELMMSKGDRKKHKELPEFITAYRGYIAGKNKTGFSYSLSIDKARWFSKRYGKEGKVATVFVAKKRVISYMDDRGEKELIIL